MEIVFQTMANGLLIGALYGLVALGFALLMGVMKFLNTAHGTFIILGGYLSYWLLELWGIDPFLSLPLVVMAMFLIGIVFYKLALSPLLKLPNIGMRINTSMLITFGSIWVLDNTMTVLWTPDVRSIMTSYTGQTLKLLGVRFSLTGLGGVGVAVLVALALYFILERDLFWQTYPGGDTGCCRSQPVWNQCSTYLFIFMWHSDRAGRRGWDGGRFKLFHQLDRRHRLAILSVCGHGSCG